MRHMHPYNRVGGFYLQHLHVRRRTVFLPVFLVPMPVSRCISVCWLVGLYVINGINLYFMMILTPFNTTTTTCNIRCCPVNIYKHMNEHQPIQVRCRYLRFVVAGYVAELSFIKNGVFTLSSMLILSTSVSGFHVSVISSILSLM